MTFNIKSVGLAALGVVAVVAYVGLNTYNAPEKKKYQPARPPQKPRADSGSSEIFRSAPTQSTPQCRAADARTARRPLNLTALNLQKSQMGEIDETNKAVFDGLFVLGKSGRANIRSVEVLGQRSVGVRIGRVHHVCSELQGRLHHSLCDANSGLTISESSNPDEIFDRMGTMLEAVA